MQQPDITFESQYSLAAFCRTGVLPAIPGVKTENLLHYRRLVYNNIDDMLQNAFPVLYSFLRLDEWNETVHQFIEDHPCQTNQVWRMPGEFREYILETTHPLLNKYVFLENLLTFEWAEMELFMMEDRPSDAQASGDVLFSKLVLNPEHQLYVFQYPVHKVAPEMITEALKGVYCVIGHRNPEGNVLFTECSPAFLQLIGFLEQTPRSMKELFGLFHTTFKIPLSNEDQQQIISFFLTALDQHLISGFKHLN
jgi:uncharacterized protein